MTKTTTTSAHSPSPWVVGVTVDSYGWPVYRLKDMVDPIAENAEVQANVRLIAAAPDMLAALKFSLECPDEEEAMRVVEAAIAKATSVSK